MSEDKPITAVKKSNEEESMVVAVLPLSKKYKLPLTVAINAPMPKNLSQEEQVKFSQKMLDDIEEIALLLAEKMGKTIDCENRFGYVIEKLRSC